MNVFLSSMTDHGKPAQPTRPTSASPATAVNSPIAATSIRSSSRKPATEVIASIAKEIRKVSTVKSACLTIGVVRETTIAFHADAMR